MIDYDEPMYSSTKDEPIDTPTSITIPEPEKIEFTTVKPVMPTYRLAEQQIQKELQSVSELPDNGNGMFILRPEQPAKTLTEPKPIFVDNEKLLDLYPAETAAQILYDIQNKNDISPEITETLIKENIISTGETESKPKIKRKTIIDNLTQFIYNLIYS